ncbi:MAG TPA: ABC-2 family transporter protein [Polyangiaceae bacterium]|jgi:ABC-2 type transport system permease protein
MRKTWRKIAAICNAYFAMWVEYRAEIYLWALAGIMPLILMGIWNQVSKNAAFSLNPNDFVRYFLAVFIVRQLTFVWVIYEFEYLIVEGALTPLLLQPINPVWRFVLAHITERIARLPFSFAILAVGFLLYPKAFWIPKLSDVALAGAVVAAAFAVRFTLQYAFAMLCFWTERAASIEDLWFWFYTFLSGLIAPLDVYPAWVRSAAELTPFPYLLYFPAQILVGRPVPLLRGCGVLLAWGIGSFLLYRLLWRLGLKRYSAMGA